MIVFNHKLQDELGGTPMTATSTVRLERESNNPRVGLVNLGNTCYMNSVLQALVMTKHFSRELLLSYPSAVAGSGSKTELVFTIQKLLAQLLHSRRPELTPREVLHVTRPPSFLPGHQQDSSEFLNHLMDTLHEHELAVRKKQRCDAAKPGTRRKRPATEEEDEDEAEKSAAIAAGHGETLVQRSFGGLLDTTNQCLSCGETSTNRDTFRDVSLSFGMVRKGRNFVFTETSKQLLLLFSISSI